MLFVVVKTRVYIPCSTFWILEPSLFLVVQIYMPQPKELLKNAFLFTYICKWWIVPLVSACILFFSFQVMCPALCMCIWSIRCVVRWMSWITWVTALYTCHGNAGWCLIAIFIGYIQWLEHYAFITQYTIFQMGGFIHPLNFFLWCLCDSFSLTWKTYQRILLRTELGMDMNI